MSAQRRIKGSPFTQGTNEQLSYTVTTTPWASGPSSPEVVLKDITDPSNVVDVSQTKLSGVATVASNVITTPKLIGLVAGRRYRLEVRFTVGSQVYEVYGEWIGEQ